MLSASLKTFTSLFLLNTLRAFAIKVAAARAEIYAKSWCKLSRQLLRFIRSTYLRRRVSLDSSSSDYLANISDFHSPSASPRTSVVNNLMKKKKFQVSNYSSRSHLIAMCLLTFWFSRYLGRFASAFESLLGWLDLRLQWRSWVCSHISLIESLPMKVRLKCNWQLR